MKKAFITFVCSLIAVIAMAVPARPGARVYTQPDGTSIQIYVYGDETYHFTTDKDGNILRLNQEGYYLPTGEQANDASIQSRRAKGKIQRPHKMRKVGSVNLAPRGLFILVNFTDSKFDSSNSLSEMKKMIAQTGYNYDGAPGSVYDYFVAQSDGKYSPQFDVYGPVTVSNNTAYYGANDSQDNDVRPEEMVIEACRLVDSQYGVDFSVYDGDNDGFVDFVYCIYAGKGEADGGAENTIWPHQWNIYEGAGQTVTIDGKKLDNYACGPELNGSTGKRNGIGTLCHEFSHVLGLPDYYDTNYSTNYKSGYTPNEWSLMDAGSYNNDGITPPNWAVHDKFYVGWYTPTIMNEAENVTLPADGKTYRQVTSSGQQATATTTGDVYYFENRQQTGWDEYLPGHGLVVWKVNYSESVWNNNAPNNTARSPRCTVVSASGAKTNIGLCAGSYSSYCNNDPFPGANNQTSYTPVSNYPLTDIAENGGVVTFKMKGGLSKYTVTFNYGRGTGTTTSLTETAVNSGITLPAANAPTGYDFIGWATKSGSYTADAGKAGDIYKPQTNITLYAVYIDQTKVLLTYNIEGLEPTATTPAEGQTPKGKEFTAAFNAADCYYTLNEDNTLAEVRVNDIIIDDAISFAGGSMLVSLTATQTTGAIEIIAIASAKLKVESSIDNATNSNVQTCIETGETYTARILTKENYTLTENDFAITMGDKDLTNGTDFTYKDSVLTIANVTGSLYIVAVARRGVPTGTITVQQALDYISTLSQGERTEEKVSVKGYVTKIDTEYSSRYGNISFNIGDTQSSSKVLLLYRTKPENSSDQAVKVGDLVLVNGYLYNYVNSKGTVTTAEMYTGSSYTIIESGSSTGGDDPTPTGCDNWNYSFTRSASEGSSVLNSMTWNIATDGGYWGYTKEKGAQIGSSNKPASYITLTAANTCKVETIVVNASTAAKNSATLSVYVGGTQVGKTQTLSSTAADYTFTLSTSLTGEIKIEYQQSSPTGALYLGSMSIEYGEGTGGNGDDNPDTPDDPDPKPDDPTPATGNEYVKVTTQPSDWSGTYLIVYETDSVALNGALSEIDVVSNTIAVTITDNKIAATEQTTAAQIQIEPSGTGYALKTSTGKYIIGASKKISLQSEAQAQTITLSEDNAIIAVGDQQLMFNATTGQKRFRYYGGTQKKVQLYKRTEGLTTGIEDKPDAVKVEKIIENNQVIIIVNGRKYNVLGQAL